MTCWTVINIIQLHKTFYISQLTKSIFNFINLLVSKRCMYNYAFHMWLNHPSLEKNKTENLRDHHFILFAFLRGEYKTMKRV
jgi:hypothetical protein